MSKADRLRALQKRFALMRMSKVGQLPSPQAAGTTITVGNAPVQLPPIRIELAVKSQNDPTQEQRVVNRTSPYVG